VPRCDRRGRLSTARLVATYGRNASEGAFPRPRGGLPELAELGLECSLQPRMRLADRDPPEDVKEERRNLRLRRLGAFAVDSFFRRCIYCRELKGAEQTCSSRKSVQLECQ
jgi:hypothetical protein